MLALRDAREPHEVLTGVARAVGRELGRPCRMYDLGAGRPDISFDVEALRSGIVVRAGSRDLVGVATDGELRAVLAVEDATAPLSPDDTAGLTAVAVFAALALSNALAFEQLRRYAAEGAALNDAARTILGFNELGPLAEALCGLALRLLRGDRAGLYGRADNGLQAIGRAQAREASPLREALPTERPQIEAALALEFGAAPFVSTSLLLPGTGGVLEESGLLVVGREGRAFDKNELRLLESLVALATLAIRNVELYEQSTRANRALEESNAFKDDLMAMFAHDFKGPLTVISGYCELLLEDANESIRGGLETIVEQTRRLVKLSADALALAATQSAGFSLRRKRHDLEKFARDAVAQLGAQAERVTVEAPGRPVLVSFDRARLRYALDNLLGNALKYSGEEVRLRVARGPGEATLEVSDRGIGIPERDRERVFARFGRASNIPKDGPTGSGVGLYIAKKIVEVHGGRLSLASREGEGTTFTLALPFD
jgi:signal transduction histidine kinase